MKPSVGSDYSLREAASFNHALQRTAAGRRGCNRHVLWPPSLSLSVIAHFGRAYEILRLLRT